jgi:hypothetical protein
MTLRPSPDLRRSSPHVRAVEHVIDLDIAQVRPRPLAGDLINERAQPMCPWPSDGLTEAHRRGGMVSIPSSEAEIGCRWLTNTPYVETQLRSRPAIVIAAGCP